MLSRDMVGGIGVITIGAIYLYFAYQLRDSALADTLGPSGIPKAYGWLMILLGSGIVVFSTAKALKAEIRIDLGTEWSGQGTKTIWAAGLLGIGIAYLMVVSHIGYASAIALLLLVAAVYQGAARNWRTLATAIGGAVALWIIFVLVLGVSMPRGFLGLI